MNDPRSIFTIKPPRLLATNTLASASADAPQERPRLQRRFSEAARDLRISGSGSSSNDGHRSTRAGAGTALADLRARAIYGVALPGPQPEAHHTPAATAETPLDDPAEGVFKSPAAPARPLPQLAAGRKRIGTAFPRLKPANKRIRLDRSARSSDSADHGERPLPADPLFFSHSPQLRPPLPPRFSSSEAAAKMLSKAQSDEQNIKTVTLARGNIGSPPVRRPTPTRSRQSNHRFSQSYSLEAVESPDTFGILTQIGVLELLEQDERPSFIVDLADDANYTSSAFSCVFQNTALRTRPELLAAISGPVADDDASTPEPAGPAASFKAWVLTARGQTTLADDVPTKCTHAGMLWTGSLLRRRLRVLSGTPLADSHHDSVTSEPFLPPSASIKSASASGPPSTGRMSLPSPTTGARGERDDYFGSSSAKAASQRSRSISRNAGAVADDRGSTIPDSTTQSSTWRVSSENSNTSYGEYQSEPSQNIGFGLDMVLSAASASDVDSFTVPATDKEPGFFDWTRLPVTDNLPRHIRFARSVDWASTAIGPIENWSADLRQMCNLIMASPHPAAMYWGEDLVAIYNEAYVLLAGQKHPSLMGQTYREAWSEIWDDVKDVFASAQTTGQATMKDDDCLFIKRNDFLEETYFSWSIIPMVGGDGTVHGLYNPAFEKTRRKIAERRMLTLREIGERTATARDVKGFWAEVLESLQCNEYDSPFVLLYSLSDESDSEESSLYSSSLSSSNKQCSLEGSLGVPAGHAAAPAFVDFHTSMEGFIPAFREVVKTNKHMLFEADKGQINSALLQDLEPRGFGDPCKAVVVCPIHPTTGESTLGFLVIGVNSRRPYDDDYNLFVQLLSRQLATSLASVVLFEEEIRRGQRAAQLAALDRIQLSEQLAARTQEAIDSETKFTRMAEFAPVGMFIADDEGQVTYCNDTWFDITRVPKDDQDVNRWVEYVSEEDKASVYSLWAELIEDTKPTSAEFRFKAPWVGKTGVFGETWVLFNAYPEKDVHGNLKSVFGCITDISQQKWAEGLQKRKMEEAVEMKRQQENFIDITSHEMRNPLSAILQCSDEIVNSLSSAKETDSPPSPTLLDENIDAAQTIALCAQHQKRIVDDILTMSKLDSALLMVTPVDVQPVTVAQRALKMFENELATADIELKFVVDDSFKQLGVDWVRFDPSRVLQVLINLTTNAIKFTTTESKKRIAVSIAASLQRPSEDGKTKVSYVPARNRRSNITAGADWGAGEVVYVQFAVEDTGRGLSAEEKKSLFLRFSQASPRTHVQYGGSGLGLFISRELTELQGGEIGVASESGKGSTFAFYVAATRSRAPESSGEPEVASLARIPSNSKKLLRKPKPQPPKARDFAPAAPPQPPAKPQTSLRVLIVEDNLVNQRVLQRQLKNIGCDVHVANHGGEALEMLQRSQYWHEPPPDGSAAISLDVVLMDQEMPVMDGLTCTEKIRELEAAGKLKKHVPIIAVTANARSAQISRILSAGMDDVVSKPYRIPDLVPKMEEIVLKYQVNETA